MKDCEGVRLGRVNRQRSSSAYMADKRCKSLPQQSAQQSVQLTALRRGLALSLLFNVVLLAVVLAIIGGN